MQKALCYFSVTCMACMPHGEKREHQQLYSFFQVELKTHRVALLGLPLHPLARAAIAKVIQHPQARPIFVFHNNHNRSCELDHVISICNHITDAAQLECIQQLLASQHLYFVLIVFKTQGQILLI